MSISSAEDSISAIRKVPDKPDILPTDRTRSCDACRRFIRAEGGDPVYGDRTIADINTSAEETGCILCCTINVAIQPHCNTLISRGHRLADLVIDIIRQHGVIDLHFMVRTGQQDLTESLVAVELYTPGKDTALGS
jgi:hypothetical protein